MNGQSKHEWNAGGAQVVEFFAVYTKLAEMAVLASKDLATAKKNNLQIGLDLMQ